ncbi:hypothetical protein D9615_005784 [Tricholomella constricta]|uniref:Arrestin-like N-terminal domain-containing protein n=1 Tax=Tricholomella constricta TaxID=117010 RepID=A0A8H5HAG6_9AGAR|nr:hypothetical protein D9615_005784 [Tricholomella constricta]
MATSAQTRPEPMNSSPHHSKVKVSMTLAHPIFVAGKFVSGKMEMECRADKGLGISVMMVELFASQELTSRDHSATSTFLHSRRLFQGPGLPPSNAVQAHPLPGDPPLPQNYHQARRGISTFLFRIPLPSSAPSSISFGSDLARVRYEVRATVGVAWKGEKRLVTCKRDIEVVESYEVDFSRVEPEGVVVGEFGKIWVQGKVVGGVLIAGESACVELQVKNHSNKKNSGLTLVLSRTLVLPGVKPGEPSALQISDVLTTVPFRGAEYVIQPGAEGVASLVFDVPKHARGVRGGTLEGDESEGRTSESLFEVRCIVGITINMGIGTKDINLDIPVPIIHPAALPEPTEYPSTPYNNNPYPASGATPSPYILQPPYAHPALPVTPPIPAAYVDPVQNQVWLPPPQSHTPQPQYFSPPINGTEQQYYFPPPPQAHIPAYLPTRPLSAGPTPNDPFSSNAIGIGMGPVSPPTSQHLIPVGNVEPEEGKGERATRVTQHLRLSSRHRSVSPRSHRFPLPAPPPGAPRYPLLIAPLSSTQQPNEVRLRNLPPPPLTMPPPSQNDNLSAQIVHSPRPFLSPKHSFTNSLPKSERVEQLERMAEEVEKTASDLSADLTKLAEPLDAKPVTPPVVVPSIPAESNINKTLPVPPPSTKKAMTKENAEQAARPRIDTYFADAPVLAAEPAPAAVKAPPTPLAAVTPVKLPFKPKSTEFHAQLHPGGKGGESGLDALEKRLLAEVGTRKMDVGNERRPVWSVVGMQPIDIPCKKAPSDPLNDSAISSLTLAGEREGGAGAGVGASAGLGEGDVDVYGGLEVDGEHDSDEKTHRAGRSSVSGESRRNSKGERGRKKGKKKEKGSERGKDGESHVSRKKKTAAAKGRVAAWLGGIDPEVPPVEQVLPMSPAVARKPSPSPDNDDAPQLASDKSAEVVPDLTTAGSGEAKAAFVEGEDVSAAPNPRSSGFVPIGTFKHGTSSRFVKPLARDATVVEEARRVADIWSSASPSSPPAMVPLKSSPAEKDRSAPVVKDISPIHPLISPAPRTAHAQSIRTNHRVSPPSSSAALDVLGAKHYNSNAAKAAPSKPGLVKSLPSKKITPQQSARLPAFPPQPDPEVKYDIRSARGGRGGRVTAITSIWASGGPEAKSNPPLKDVPSSTPKPRRTPMPEAEVRDTPGLLAGAADPGPLITKPPPPPPRTPRTPVKSLLTASAPHTHAHSVNKQAHAQASEPKPTPAGKRPRPMIKSSSSSVPAVISSSHAIPTLSSTASLARPSPNKNKNRSPQFKVPPTIVEARPDSGGRISTANANAPASATTKPAAGGGEMAFGQARLRDLIKKYQGQAA